MDGMNFDRWTRRAFGVAAGGALVSLLGRGRGGSTSETAAKHRKHRHKARCRKRGETCGGGKGKCCAGRTCDQVGFDGNPQKRCCVGNLQGCAADRDCCAPALCDPVDKVCLIALSDRDAKTNLASIDRRDMPRRVEELPISTWSYRADDRAVRHIGPMAQDFAALFSVGADERSIHPIDGQGVALAAIQGLADLVTGLQAEQQRLLTRIVDLERAGLERNAQLTAAHRLLTDQ